MSLRESTAELHKIAEQKRFNQRMVNGELSKSEYVEYLHQQFYIFKAIEYFSLPHESLKRLDCVLDDIEELDLFNPELLLESTKEYVNYLLELNEESILPHVYLNYLALLYGGQIIKNKVHGSGKMYTFKNKEECINNIRKVQSDEWSEEVNKGFKFIINILDELQRNFR
jgi:heme oxygenase